jgi:large subunit ribosomal protein L4
MYRGAVRSILSELARSERLSIVQEMVLSEPKTKELAAKLGELSCETA